MMMTIADARMIILGRIVMMTMVMSILPDYDRLVLNMMIYDDDNMEIWVKMHVGKNCDQRLL